MKWFSLLLLPFLMFGQYELKKDVISSGGTRMTSTNYVLNGTVSQTTIGEVTGGTYKAIIGFWHSFDYWPPIAPNIITVQKLGSDARLVWNKVATDTLGNAEIIDYYIVYRSTTPNFVPGLSDSIGYAKPDTFYSDVGAVPPGQDYYYLVKAIDYGPNRSNPSNMGFKFRQTLNENASLTDKNWVSLPYRNNYPNASDFYTDVGLDVCYGIRKLNPATQGYTTCWWDPDMLEFVDDYPILIGAGYEVLASVDSAVRITGAHDPNFNMSLNENASLTDKNWTSIPYNVIYTNASEVYTDIGLDICYGIRKLNPTTQGYTTCWWDPDMLEFVDDYPLIRGTAYEILVNTDATWKPDVHTNRGGLIQVSDPVKEHLGTMAILRKPDWDVGASFRKKETNVEADDVVDVTIPEKLPYMVRGRIKGDALGLSFLCYVKDRPSELLNEDVQSCGIMTRKKMTKWRAELGNLPSPWYAGEEAVVVFSKKGFYGVASHKISSTVDIVDLPSIELQPIPDVTVNEDQDAGVELSWQAVENPLVIGYSLYKSMNGGVLQRMNDEIIKEPRYIIASDEAGSQYELRLVFAGGWESGFHKNDAVAHNDGVQSSDNKQIPIQFALANGIPNPFYKTTTINFAVAQARRVQIKLYDVTGKLVKVLKDEKLEPGYYSVNWNGEDDLNRTVSAGVYFCKFVAGGFNVTRKLVVTR